MLLALETSTQLGGVALVEQGQILAHESSTHQKSHSEVLNAMIDSCLKKAGVQLTDLDLVATGLGPGSFTGIRVAGNIAKSLSYSLEIPMFSLDSLYLLACQVSRRDIPVLAMINAYKNMVYYGLYDVSQEHPKSLINPSVIPVRQLDSVISAPAFSVVGDGYNTYLQYFSDAFRKKTVRQDPAQDFPSAATLGLKAELLNGTIPTFDWKSYRPLYIRASEAEENKRGVVFTPLK